MINQWFFKKEKALHLRKQGLSLRQIAKQLNISKSTLSGWFKDIPLTQKQKQKLLKQWRSGLVKARSEAAKWHNNEKAKRLVLARDQALETLNNIEVDNKDIVDLALAMLYLGEGFKSNSETGIGNSDPLILKFFLVALNKIYNIDISKIRCELHLREDQNAVKLKKFWSKELGLSINNFKYVYFDKRTIGSKTREDYKGVCMLRCGNVAIQRKLITMSREFCKRIIERV